MIRKTGKKVKRRYALIVSSILFVFLFAIPFSIYAHGGVQQVAGSVIVSLSQIPISPFVGEKVKMSFYLADFKNNGLSNIPVHLRLIDTFFNDATKDQVLLTKDVKTDQDGIFNFEYTFNRANYYDVELTFNDPDNQKEVTGFLIQTRDKPKNTNSSVPIGLYVVIGLIGFGLGWVIRSWLPKGV